MMWEEKILMVQKTKTLLRVRVQGKEIVYVSHALKEHVNSIYGLELNAHIEWPPIQSTHTIYDGLTHAPQNRITNL
jgi:hypothetical protein